MSMADGVKDIVSRALDSKDDLAAMLIKGGMDPIAALQASSIITKDKVAEVIDRRFGNADAATITSTLSNEYESLTIQ